MKEVWKPVLGYEKLYLVSNIGNIKSLCGRKKESVLLHPSKTKMGYLRVGLSDGESAKQYFVHRLVIEAFNGKIPNGMVVDHLDGIKDNNHIENLEVITQQENLARAWKNGQSGDRSGHCSEKTKLKISLANSKEVIQYNKNHEEINRFYGLHDAERKTGISFKAISLCCLGKNKTSGGYIWRYAREVDKYD